MITDVNEEIAKARAVKRPARRVTVRRNDGKTEDKVVKIFLTRTANVKIFRFSLFIRSF